MVLRAGDAGADVGEHQIAPAVERHQPVGGGEVAAQLPFGIADLALQRWDVQSGVLNGCVGVHSACSGVLRTVAAL